MTTTERTWKVGELARETGVTVRTLHHFETKGLLAPSARTEAGYRLYSPDDVRRLYRVLALRGIPTEQFIDTMEAITSMNTYFTPEQQADLARRAEALGPDGLKQAEREWVDHIAEVRAEIDRGTEPSDPVMQPLAQRWHALIAAFTGGDLAIARGVAQRYEDEGWEKPSQGMLDSAVMEYMGRVFESAGNG